MFYGEIMSLQRLHQSGCLLVNYFDVRSAEKAFNLLPNLARSLHQIDVTVERPSNVDSADSNTPTSSSCSISKSHTLKVETSNLEAVSFLDTGLIRSINREHNFHSPLSQSLTAAVNINTDNAPKSNSSPSLSSKNLTNSSTNLCGEPLWSTVYPPITRRASEMPYSYSQQQLRNSFMCKAVPAAADDFSTTGMDDFLMKSNGNGLTSPGSAPTNPSSISSEPLVTGLNTSDEFLAEKIISTRGDSPSRTRERSTRHPYLPSTSYPPAMPSFSPPPSVSRTNHTLRLNLGMIDNPSTCASGCKHSSVTMSTNSMSNNQNFHYPHQQSSNSLSYSPSTLTVPSKYEISPSPTHPLHCSPSHSQNSQSHHNHHNQHHHHHHHSNNNNNLRHHHNHYYNSFQGNKKQSNYGYSTCLRSNSALPKIDLIPRENEFELERLLGGKDTRTTIMIRNIPNKYSQQMLLDFINESHKGQYDFLYLRMDFKNRCNVGYAFCNLISVHALCSFAQRVIGKKWTRFNSDKVCMLSYANIQGKQALIEKFRNSSVMDEHPTYRPKIFITSGPFAGGEEVFPLPVNRVPRLISGSSSSVACPSSHLSTSPLEYTHEQHEEKRSYFCDYSTPAYTQFQEYSGYSSASSQLPLDSPLPQY
ncbi:hypothetical protein HMI54_008788 [Coelomomyces lativittatus]|nr:hypothetical protein HMI54_008788 [Coelomomyces lativittatus]